MGSVRLDQRVFDERDEEPDRAVVSFEVVKNLFMLLLKTFFSVQIFLKHLELRDRWLIKVAELKLNQAIF